MQLNPIDGDKPLAEGPGTGASTAVTSTSTSTPSSSTADRAGTTTGDVGRYHIELVDKVVRLLEALRDQPNGLTLQELALRTGYVKSSVHRAMQSLKVRGYVEQPMTGGPYRLGVQCLLLARCLQEGIGLIGLARPYMRAMRTITWMPREPEVLGAP